MQLVVDSDAAYLVLPEAKSRIAGHFYLSNTQRKPNGPLHVLCKVLRHVTSSAAETETAAMFHNAQLAIFIRRILEQIGHKQHPTKLITDNSTAATFTNQTLKLNKSKSWDMRYHWLRENEVKKNFQYLWEQGLKNGADYYTKHHPPHVHKTLRPKYLLNMIQAQTAKILQKHIPESTLQY